MFRFTRTDPLKAFPPCFVTALMTPPVNRPYSAETPDVIVVVSWMASSMKRLFGVPRRLSWMFTPLIVMTLSNDWAPETVTAALGPFALTPGLRTTEARIVRATGSFFVVSAEKVVAACAVCDTDSLWATTVASAATDEMESFVLTAICWLAETLTFLVTGWKPGMTNETT